MGEIGVYACARHFCSAKFSAQLNNMQKKDSRPHILNNTPFHSEGKNTVHPKTTLRPRFACVQLFCYQAVAPTGIFELKLASFEFQNCK
jgi:hypothetical protein